MIFFLAETGTLNVIDWPRVDDLQWPALSAGYDQSFEWTPFVLPALFCADGHAQRRRRRLHALLLLPSR